MADSLAIVAESVVEKIKPLRLLILKGLSGADGTSYIIYSLPDESGQRFKKHRLTAYYN